MAIMIMWFLVSLGADALANTINLNEATLGRFGKSFVLTAGDETFVFSKAEGGYSVVYNGGGKAEFRRNWRLAQEECLHADAAHRQAEEDLYCSDGEAEYEKATQRLRGCRFAFDLLTRQVNGDYWRAP